MPPTTRLENNDGETLIGTSQQDPLQNLTFDVTEKDDCTVPGVIGINDTGLYLF